MPVTKSVLRDADFVKIGSAIFKASPLISSAAAGWTVETLQRFTGWPEPTSVADMYWAQLIGIVGVWLLARRFFQLPAAVFIALSVAGSAVWLDQPYWNFRLYYALPLVVELGHRFLETGRWRWFFLAANLLAIQVIGNLPYFIPVASLAVFVYFAGFAATQSRN